MRISTLPDSSRGVDVNRPITAAQAAAFVAKGDTFACRYIVRQHVNPYDLSVSERDIILDAGLGLQIVQHVAPPDWVPTSDLGKQYGDTAVNALVALGILPGVSVWVDLEGVRDTTPHADVIAFSNNWFAAVKAAGYKEGAYIGFHCGLTPDEQYHELTCGAYWSAFTNNSDDGPVIRGFQMYQHAAKASDLISGFTNQDMDCDTIRADAMAGTPTLLFA